MKFFQPPPDDVSQAGYYSAEFQLNHSKIMYQFKIRKSSDEPMFAIVKEGSRALENISEGDVVDMLYHYQDNALPSESKLTRIKYIVKDGRMGFKDHYVIGLSLNVDKERSVA